MSWFSGLSLFMILLVMVIVAVFYMRSLVDYVTKYIIELQTSQTKSEQKILEDFHALQRKFTLLKEDHELVKKAIEEKKNKNLNAKK
jgi:hypothetical protein